MRRAAPWIALLAAAGVAAFLLLRDRPRAPPSSYLRPAPAVPTPTVEQKVAYFYGVLRGGKTLVLKAPVAGAAPFDVPVWSEIGGNALLGLGDPALAFLMSPERRPEYVQAPNVLVTVLDLLVRARASPLLFPFLDHWLDEKNCPRPVPGSDWPDDIRLHVFALLKARPLAAAAPACQAELDRPRHAHDLRGAAISVLLALCDADVLNGIYATLPPTPETPEPDLRAELLERLFQMAAPGAGDRNRAQVEALQPMLLEVRETGRPLDRIGATAVLYRLGKPGMGEQLRGFFEEFRDREALAWAALKLLAADAPDPFVKTACLERVKTPDKAVGFTTAVRLLTQWWPEEVRPRFLEWARAGVLDPYMVLAAMLRLDRELVLGWLRAELSGSDMAAVLRALTFVAGERIQELVPEVLELARRLDPSNRPPVYRTLVGLRAPGVEALLLAELAGGAPDAIRGAAAAELLNFGGAAGEARLGELLRAGDGAVLDAILVRTRMFHAAGLPEGLVPAVLHALSRMPSEDGRRAALLVLRFRGRFDDVREGLIEAYRSEPSRRVAQEIGAAIEELAHR